ncbi:hypothetical protein KQH62_00595 [bacterium]|nr:hypothetical protein [bacterium]
MTDLKQKRRQLWLPQFLFGLSLVFLGFGLWAVGWVVWPEASDMVQYQLPAGTLPGSPAGEDYASLADYTLTVEWPRRLRVGQAGELQVILAERDADAEPAQGAQIVLVEPALFGLTLDPPGMLQVSKAPGHALTPSWDVTGQSAGDYAGKVYISFGFYDAEEETMSAVPVAVADVSVSVSAFFGLNAQLALWFGLVALVLWGALFVLGRVAAGK